MTMGDGWTIRLFAATTYSRLPLLPPDLGLWVGLEPSPPRCSGRVLLLLLRRTASSSSAAFLGPLLSRDSLLRLAGRFVLASDGINLCFALYVGPPIRTMRGSAKHARHR